MAATSADHESALRSAGVPEVACAALVSYLDLLAAWADALNLTSARTAQARVDVLIVPALSLLPWLLPGALLDVGSGNGSPGLVLAVLDERRAVTLLEPRTRRWAFLREAARASGRADVAVLKLRHDSYSGPPAANVTLRGLRLREADLARLIAPGGQALLSGPLPGAAPLPGVAAFRYRPGACST